MKLICFDCGGEPPAAERGKAAAGTVLCACGGLFDIVRDHRATDADRLKRTFDARLAERLGPYASGVWRYKELIYPELPEASIVTKYEGNTGLYRPDKARSYAGVRELWLKALSENPSGSFKDNGMTVAVSHGHAHGHRAFACASTGNTAASLAMYGALIDAQTYVYLPEEGVSRDKLLQALAYGARLVPLAGGSYDAGIRLLGANGGSPDLYVCNSINPYRIEGQKSIMFEIAHTLGWRLPDWLVLPGGALSNATAAGKALRELHALGFIDRLPRIAVIQAEGAAPFHRLVEQGAAQLMPEPRPRTAASALNIGNPPSWKKALRLAIEATNGVTAAVTDEEIMAAKAVVDRCGIGCEPAAAASLAGLRKLVAAGVVGAEETAVCLLTGHLLKDTAALQRAYG
ncbi:MAG: threonine synthase [Paenibacillaceae bacterium]|nr:threonine synthase [Paenibacillaceae bacterium]